MPEEVAFRTKPQIAIGLIDRALSQGVRVEAWTFDELYGRDGKFLNALEARKQPFVGEIPCNFRGWVQPPRPRRTERKKTGKSGSARKSPGRTPRRPACEVRNLVKYSPVFREQSWQRYRIKDTGRGPEVWEVKWAVFWRRDEGGRPTRRHTLLVARKVLTGEVKYFLSNRVPGERNPVTGEWVTLRGLLRIAFGRWSIESCFRQAKDELGLDHYQVRGWRCVRRHFFVTQLSHLFCARMRREYDRSTGASADRLTVEQVRSAMNVWLETADLPPAARRRRYEEELRKQQHYQRRSQQSRASHTQTRIEQLTALGIDVTRLKSCLPHDQP